MKKEKLDSIMEALRDTSIKDCEVSSKGFYMHLSRSIDSASGTALKAKQVAQQSSAPKSAEDKQKPDAGKPSSDHDITTTWVGYFFRGKEKGGKPLVKLRDVVKEGQQVGIVITMNVVHKILAPCSGKITEILIEDGQAVEYGQPLLRISEE